MLGTLNMRRKGEPEPERDELEHEHERPTTQLLSDTSHHKSNIYKLHTLLLFSHPRPLMDYHTST